MNEIIIIVGHGKLPQALRYSIEMITGDTSRIEIISLEPSFGPKDIINQLNQIMAKVEKERRILVLTDLMGGSPNNTVTAKLMEDPRVDVISGVNLAILLSAVLEPNKNIDELISVGRSGIVNVKKKISTIENDEE